VLQLLGINQVIPPVMDPLTPDDPLWKLLGQSRPVELRPDFVRNVMRAARQTPQDKGWLASLKARWQEASWTQTGLSWAAAGAIAILGIVSVLPEAIPDHGPASSTQLSAVDQPSADFMVPEFESEWRNLEHMGDLLVVNDTTGLTDQEIQLLLY
jgi:hypothetical protein